MTLLKNPLRAKDALPTLASKLPEHLFIEGASSYGNFSIAFLATLDENQLQKLNDEAAKLDLRDTNEFRLCFYTQANKHATAVELKDFDSFEWTKVKSVKISGDTTPYFDDEYDMTYCYVSILFNMQEE